MAPEEVVRSFIAAFIDVWPTGRAVELVRYFSEDAVYHNMPLRPVRGREAILKSLEEFMSAGGTVAIDVLNLIADGRIVMIERVDHLVTADRTVSVPMAGVFELENGQINAWRDYFDLGQAQ